MDKNQLKLFIMLFNFICCEFIANIIIVVICVAFNLNKADFVLFCLIDQRNPEILIFDRLFLRIDPAVPLPGQCPAVMKGIADISAIRINRYFARLLERAKPHDHGG